MLTQHKEPLWVCHYQTIISLKPNTSATWYLQSCTITSVSINKGVKTLSHHLLNQIDCTKLGTMGSLYIWSEINTQVQFWQLLTYLYFLGELPIHAVSTSMSTIKLNCLFFIYYFYFLHTIKCEYDMTVLPLTNHSYILQRPFIYDVDWRGNTVLIL